jgi:cytosine/creatinine deaminase
MDLIIRNVRLSQARADGPVDIGVERGRIVEIAPRLDGDAESFDAGGRLACAGLVETHIHLDKSRIIDRCGPEEGRDVAAVKRIRPLKPHFTVEDVRARAARTLEQAILNGTTRMRSHVEVDPAIGLRGFDGVRSLIADYRWAIDLELCVFPQEGLTNYPGTDALLVEGLRRGAKAIGAAPRYDTDHPGQITRIFELAREFDVDIDMHLDFGNTPEAPDIPLVLELTQTYGLGGRVTVGHMTKLSTMAPQSVAEVCRRLGDVGIAVTVLPATDLFLMGRDQDHDIRRGVVDANLLLEQGVNCSISTNNVLNPATPYGDCSLIRMANLHANVLQVSTCERLRDCFFMISERSARLLNLPDYGLAVGNPADIVVIDAETPEQTIAEIRQPLAVWKRGRRTVTRHPAELHRP